jgi:hypothetical protein
MNNINDWSEEEIRRRSEEELQRYWEYREIHGPAVKTPYLYTHHLASSNVDPNASDHFNPVIWDLGDLPGATSSRQTSLVRF